MIGEPKIYYKVQGYLFYYPTLEKAKKSKLYIPGKHNKWGSRIIKVTEEVVA